MTPTSLEEAQAAADKLLTALIDLPELAGIGIAVLEGGGYGIKVNLERSPATAVIPSEVDGVPVIVEIVGEIEAR